MSVPKAKRHVPKDKLEVEDKADKLASYVFTLSKNEGVLPKRYRYSITTPMMETAINISKCISMANSYRLDIETEARKRLELQREAIAYTYGLEKILIIAYENIDSFPEHKINVLGDHIVTLRSYISNWIRSDKTRIKNLSGQLPDE